MLTATPADRQLVGAHPEGSIVVTQSGSFARVAGGEMARYEVKPRGDAAELRALIGLRDSLDQLLALEATSADDEACAPARDSLDVEAQRATKAAIFDTRVVAPRQPRRGAETAQDALAVCLDERGAPDLATIASLLGTDEDSARSELGELVWDDPLDGALVAAPTYLSGDVRAKLAAAEQAAAGDPRWQANVDTLRAVVPVDLGPAEIDARLGSTWIPADDVAAFGREVLGCRSIAVEHAAVTATWAARARAGSASRLAATSLWGTNRADAVALLQSSLNQIPVTVYDTLDDGRRVANPAETLAAREKQEALGERFAAWVWEDPERCQRLVEDYNRLFNSTVLPRHDGSHLSLPGLAANFAPHAHQRDGVWHIISEPTALMAHYVGAGKTATMAMASQELRRLGLVTKPCFVVPDHMLDQFSREFSQLDPTAKVLVASKDDVSAEARKGFVARCATGDWDAVVITASAFGRIPVSDETRRAFVEERLAELRTAIAESKAGERLTVKRLEARLAQTEAKHAKLLDEAGKDDGVSFEHTGIDYLFVDEAHHFKNRQFATHISGVGGEGSRRAEDLELKLGYLRSRHGSRVTTFATATPIANSLSEMWVMQSYLQPERLAAAGLRRLGRHLRAHGDRLGAGPARRLLPAQHPLRPLRQRARAAHHVPGQRRCAQRRPAGPGHSRRRRRCPRDGGVARLGGPAALRGRPGGPGRAGPGPTGHA
ncbi:MAG: DEAD/DEAH box helicase family protein [Actinomycetota bacterium]|nr:DEAD/DEAH box helicase family protein [Actinomycetota bacterium]